ncbi:hypothetical protein RB195_000178 [Necator americanus]|uniref:Uncharacterized protein n=1 Tax=Necator americanus TaxID=51031 RepID=A0ABR1D8Y6_NECAM
MKIIGHLLIWAGSLTIALIPWVERRNIIKKYKFDSDVTYFATCHLLGWGQWSQCPKMGSPNLKQALPVPSKSFFTQMQLYFRYATTLYLNFLPRCIYRKESFFA